MLQESSIILLVFNYTSGVLIMLLESSIILLVFNYTSRVLIMLLESSIMLLESSIMLLQNIYSTDITHDDCHLRSSYFYSSGHKIVWNYGSLTEEASSVQLTSLY
jgi:hypothetical protein